MHVLYDHSIFVMQRFGGVSRLFVELIPRVVGAGADVSLCMGLHLSGYGLERRRDSLAAFAGMRRPNLAKTHRLAMALSDAWFERFARRSDPDIYHPTWYTVAATGLRARRVMTVHDMTSERIPQFFGGPENESTRVKRAAVQSASALICVSEHTRRDLVELFDVRESKIRVIPLAGPHPAPQPGPAIIKEPYILHVGVRRGYKNFDRLLEAYAASARLRSDFHLVCAGGKPFSASERQAAARLGVEHRLRFFPVSDEELANLYRYAKVFVYPSLYEGFGIPTLEAFQQGCPVLLSARSSLPEVGGDAALYFDPENTEELTARLESVLYDPALARRLATAGLLREKAFSWDRCAAETLAFYRELL